MPTLKITGDLLAGKSKNERILNKKKRMKFVMINGLGWISLAIFLFFQSHYKQIDTIFQIAQFAEFCLGLINLALIVFNAKSGLKLSVKLS